VHSQLRGGTVNQLQLKGPAIGSSESIAELNEPFSICYEASCGYGHLYEQLRPLAHHVAVAHPGKLRLIYGSKRKNDRVDAQKLAKLLLLDMVPPVHVPNVDVRAWRSLIVLRQRVLQQVVRAKNQIRGVLRENDLAGAKWLWSKKQLAWLESLELHPVAKLRWSWRSRSSNRWTRESSGSRKSCRSTPIARRREAADDDPGRGHPHGRDVRGVGG
jgi:hypothetical protein